MMSWEESKLSAQRVRLRSINDHDLEDVFQGLSDPRVIRYYEVSFYIGIIIWNYNEPASLLSAKLQHKINHSV